MTTDRAEVFQWLATGPRWGRLATIGPDGFPHSVPLSFLVEDDSVLINLSGQRLANVRRNPKICFVVDSGSSMADLKGAVLQGTAEMIEDYDERVRVAQAGVRKRGIAEADLPTSVAEDRYYLRLRPQKIATWDYAKR